MIIYARSPYFISITINSGLGSKLEIFLSNGSQSLPSTPTYTIVKNYNQGTGNTQNYNISNFIREYIENITMSSANNYNSAKVRVKSYQETSVGVYSLVSTQDYLATNGYTLYTQGANATDISNRCVLLFNPSIEYYYNRDSGVNPMLNILVNTTVGDKLEVTLTDLSGGNSSTTTLIGTGTGATQGILNATLTSVANSAYNNGNLCTIKYYEGASLTVNKTIKVTPICEPKYTPVKCTFINRFGGWQLLTFFKAKTNSIEVSSTSYNTLPSGVAYNPSLPQTASFNINGRQSVRLNTGWVPESYSELIQDLLLAETILLDDKPVEIKTQSTELKTSLKDRNINYEIEFEYAYNLINNVV